ncbi:hypothetical protein DKG77_12255 [Flagellimonas aquimarina]|uniref:Immunity protein 43 domain-containing protein n=1 Tax=Flagellimonas aquimarina TaxID=2201895 RepID=A0A316KZH9_9FLAO|nr:hypothetical protein [Allomuricauda koreensis]PWL38991.1 hypothetical protein DKG77_12255 [Allomuricauda koreensis]
MEYFFLQQSTRTKEVGILPQWESYKIKGDLNQLHGTGPIEGMVNLPEPILRKKARPTTYLDMTVVANSLVYMVVKQHFLNFLMKFNIGEYQTWNLKIHHKGKVLEDYCVVYFSHPAKCVEYDLSNFYTGKIDDWRYNGKEINIADQDEFLTMAKDMYTAGLKIKSKSMVLNFSKIKKDIVRIANVPFGSGYYISENLKNAILEQRFTGMEFIPCEELWNGRIKAIY